MQPAQQLAIRRAQQRHGVQTGLVQHRLKRAEGQKAVMAMILAHAGSAYPAKRQAILHHMQQRVVDHHAAGVRVFQHLADAGAIMVKQVQRQRARAGLNPGQGVGQIVVHQQRQNRAKNFFFQHRLPVRHRPQQLRGQLAHGT